MSYRLKLAIFALSALLFLFAVDTAYQAVNTLKRLDIVEAERDPWQRPNDVIRALDLRPDSRVVDLGCGAGYFTVRLASAVSAGGSVYAVDIRRLPLIFLWARTVTRHLHNVTIVMGQPDDPRLSPGMADAVLISNTYHELQNPGMMLDRIFQSLLPGGRLVVVEPLQSEHGERSHEPVEDELKLHGFEVVKSEDRFIDQPATGRWWLVVGRKPISV